MKRSSITIAALVLALVPATVGLWGNASFSQAVPVQVPASGQVATGTATLPRTSRTTQAADDHGGDRPRDQRTEAGDDRATRGGPSATSTSHRSTRSTTSTTSTPSATHDDDGGQAPRDQRTEAGDDRGSGSDDSSADDSGSGHSGSDDSGSGHSGSDDSGSRHGGDDHGGDD